MDDDGRTNESREARSATQNEARLSAPPEAGSIPAILVGLPHRNAKEVATIRHR